MLHLALRASFCEDVFWVNFRASREFAALEVLETPQFCSWLLPASLNAGLNVSGNQAGMKPEELELLVNKVGRSGSGVGELCVENVKGWVLT